MRYLGKIMKKYLYLLSFIFILTSCVDAPENGREKGKDDRDRDEQDGPCPNCITDTSSLTSNLHRTKGSEPISMEKMREAIAANKLPDGYRIIPNPSKDHDAAVTIYGFDTTELAKFNDCGEEDNFKSVKSMLNSCFNKNDAGVHWLAKPNGAAGEADWQIALINRTDGHLFWMDKRTNLLWSEQLTAQEWNIASGQNLSTGEVSYCAKLNDIEPKLISWRLPNRAEFLQADVDGARYVLSSVSTWYWTATSEHNSERAWAIQQNTGILKLVDKNLPLNVRCVGEMLK